MCKVTPRYTSLIFTDSSLFFLTICKDKPLDTSAGLKVVEIADYNEKI